MRETRPGGLLHRRFLRLDGFAAPAIDDITNAAAGLAAAEAESEQMAQADAGGLGCFDRIVGDHNGLLKHMIDANPQAS